MILDSYQSMIIIINFHQYREIKQVLFQYRKLWIFKARKYCPDGCPDFEEKVIRFANSTSEAKILFLTWILHS